MTLGEQIRQAREGKNLSQEELADRLNVSRQAVSKWENNNSIPQGLNRELLTQVLELELPSSAGRDEELTHSQFRRRFLTWGCFFMAAMAVITLIVTLWFGEKRAADFKSIRFYDSDMKEIKEETLRYNAAQITCILVQWEGTAPDSVKIFSTSGGSDLLSETALLLTQPLAKDENLALLSAVSLQSILQGKVIFGLDYGDHVIMSEVYDIFYDEEALRSEEQSQEEFLPTTRYETEKEFTRVIIGNKQEIIEYIAAILEKAESVCYDLSNFELDIAEIRGDRADLFFRADWKLIRKPEDDPFIQGMYQAAETLTDEAEIAHARKIADDWVSEMNSWPETERIDTHVVICLDAQNCWRIYYPYVMNGVEELILLDKYAAENWTENAEERRQQGMDIINNDIEWFRSQT